MSPILNNNQSRRRNINRRYRLSRNLERIHDAAQFAAKPDMPKEGESHARHHGNRNRYARAFPGKIESVGGFP
jgi:hypothetical protein